jgi:hypothetical protein
MSHRPTRTAPAKPAAPAIDASLDPNSPQGILAALGNPPGYKCFRNPKAGGGTARIPLKSGHAALVGPTWKPLAPRFHRKAYAQGLVSHDQAGANAAPVPVDPEAAQRARAGKISRAIAMLVERRLDGDFTTDGIPSMKAVEAIVGFNCSRAEVTALWATMKDEAGNDDDATARKAAEAAAAGSFDADEDGDDVGDAEQDVE